MEQCQQRMDLQWMQFIVHHFQELFKGEIDRKPMDLMVQTVGSPQFSHEDLYNSCLPNSWADMREIRLTGEDDLYVYMYIYIIYIYIIIYIYTYIHKT